MQMPFSRLAESALFCANFAVAPAGLICLACAIPAEVLPSVSKVAGVWRSLFWCLESVMLWRGIMGFTKFGDKRVNDLDLLSGYVVGVACLHRENPCRRICMQLAPRTS